MAYSPFANRKKGGRTFKKFAESIMELLNTEIDLTAEISLNDSLKEAAQKATAKYFCISCKNRINYQRHKYESALCRFCEPKYKCGVCAKRISKVRHRKKDGLCKLCYSMFYQPVEPGHQTRANQNNV